MSQQLISRSADLKRLRDEGYAVEVKDAYLLVKNVPYVTASKEVKLGILVSDLALKGDVTTTPTDHVVYFAGEYPCDKNGAEIAKIRLETAQRQLGQNLVVHHRFSSKPQPAGAYQDYYEKMTTYVAILSNEAAAIDASVTPRCFQVIESAAEEAVFNYLDTASSRAEITVVTKKLELPKIAIVGVGGTGSYVLDLVAKTPVEEIHLFDKDVFLQHNAFRSPGAPSVDDLNTAPKKVAYFAGQYAKMRRGVVPHDCHIDASNVEELRTMSFVFLCLDKGSSKSLIIEKLEESAIPFIDVGMGVTLVDDSLLGVLRVTSSTPTKRAHVRERNRIPLSDGDGNNEYDRNIQIADLNALNAALAVIKWKKLCGFYHDLEHEHFTTFTIDGNTLTNEDHA